MDIQLDPSNKPAQEFLIYQKIQDGRRGSKVQNRPNLTPQITFRLGIWFSFIRFGQNLAWTYYLTFQTHLHKNFSFIIIFKMAARGLKVQNLPNLNPQITFQLAFGFRSSDLDKTRHEHSTWPFKQVCPRIYQLGQNPRWPLGIKGPKSTKFDSTNHISARHLDSFLSDLDKVWHGHTTWPYKCLKSTKFDPTNHILTRHLDPFIRFGKSLAWTYYLTLQTNLCKNFSFSTKSKMTAGGQMSKIN